MEKGQNWLDDCLETNKIINQMCGYEDDYIEKLLKECEKNLLDTDDDDKV